jgi:hypothetical protein
MQEIKLIMNELIKYISIGFIIFILLFNTLIKIFMYWEMLSIKHILERLDMDLYDKYMRLRYNTKQIEKAIKEQNKDNLCQ